MISCVGVFSFSIYVMNYFLNKYKRLWFTLFSFSPFFIVKLYGRITEEVLEIFNKAARLLVTGFSGSWKSTFICKMIEKYRNKFQRVTVLGSDLDISNHLNIEFKSEFEFIPFREISMGSTHLNFDDIIYIKKLLTSAGEIFERTSPKHFFHISNAKHFLER